MPNNIKDIIEHLLLSTNLGAASVSALTFITLCAILVAVCILLYILCKAIVIPITHTITKKTVTRLDDILLNWKFMKALCRTIPALVFAGLLPQCISDPTNPPFAYHATKHLADAFVTLTFIWVITSALNNARDYANQSDYLKDYHLEGILQFIKMLVYILGGIVILANIVNKNPLTLFAGLGAAATILMLIFKDSILGLVASIQISVNRMIKKEDWIIIENKNINGVVEEINLTTVKVRNFDNSVSMIPPYSLVSESFQNWGRMLETGKRRVMRNILIDARTIHFADSKQTATNLYQFRQDAEEYLRNHPCVCTDDWLMARELESTPYGLPMQLWFYLNITEFVAYEQTAASIMENLIAILPKYGLKIYQYTSAPD